MFHAKGLTWLFIMGAAAVAAEIVFLAVFARPTARLPPEVGPTKEARSEAPPLLVPTTVTIDDPASGLADVRLEFGEALLRGRNDLLLGFADVHGRPNVVRSFAAAVDGKTTASRVETYRGALLQRIPLARATRSLSVSYTIDPTFYPDWPGTLQPTDARSRITADLQQGRVVLGLGRGTPTIGRSGLDEGVRRVLTSRRTALTTAELRALLAEEYGSLLDDDFDRYVVGMDALPDLGLGPATGRSGCARPVQMLIEPPR